VRFLVIPSTSVLRQDSSPKIAQFCVEWNTKLYAHTLTHCRVVRVSITSRNVCVFLCLLTGWNKSDDWMIQSINELNVSTVFACSRAYVFVYVIVVKLSLTVSAACLHEWNCFRAYYGTLLLLRDVKMLFRTHSCVQSTSITPRRLVLTYKETRSVRHTLIGRSPSFSTRSSRLSIGYNTVWSELCECKNTSHCSRTFCITETIYWTSFYLNDISVRMICETELMTENWFRKKLD